MPIYSPKELRNFIILLDRELTGRAEVVGGAAAALHYNAKGGTVDIDAYGSIRHLSQALKRIKVKYPDLRIPFTQSAVAHGPQEMDSCYEAYEESLFTNLKIFIPEVHDLILLKTARCDEKDLSDIKRLAQQREVKAETLLTRFKNEMLPSNPASDEVLLYNYLTVVGILFGQELADEHEKALQQ